MVNSIVSEDNFSILHSLESSSLSRTQWPLLRLSNVQMDIIIMPYIPLDHILEIIQSRSYSPILSSYGARSMSLLVVQYVLMFILLNRCLAPRDDLDRPDQSYLCREHTNILLDAWPTLKLWDEYGMIDNIQVSSISYLYLSNWQISVFHHAFSPSGYIRNDNSWSPPSSNQGGIQGPCCWVGPTMAGLHPWWSSGQQDTGGYWPAVRCLFGFDTMTYCPPE